MSNNINVVVKHVGSTISTGFNAGVEAIVLVGYHEVRFFQNGHVSVAYNPEGKWSWTKSVGDYDDWQLVEVVERAAQALGREVQGWYEE